MRQKNTIKAIHKAHKALQMSTELSNKASYPKGMADALTNLAFLHFLNSSFENALTKLTEAKTIYKEINDTEGLGKNLMIRAVILWRVGEYEKALKLCFRSLTVVKDKREVEHRPWAYYTLGAFYYDLKDYGKSLENYSLALKVFKDENQKDGIARCKNGIGLVYEQQKDFQQGLLAHEAALNIQEEQQDLVGMSRSLNDLGNIYHKLQNFEEALIFFKKSLAIRKEINHKETIITTLLNLGRLYTSTQDYDQAIRDLKIALEIAEEIKVRPKLYQIHEAMAEVYKRIDQPWEALKHYEQFMTYKSELLGEETNSKIKNLQTTMAVEESERAAELLKKHNENLQKAYDEIEEKSQQLLDSIHYAKKIQEATMVDTKIIFDQLQDAFIFYLPKDIVSGDFYWYSQLDNGNIIFATIDCTGHGVPGAFMTVLANSLLNQIVNELDIHSPAQILQLLDQKLTASLQGDNHYGYYHGLDIALINLDLANLNASYAGARSPLIHITHPIGAPQLDVIKPDKCPIGSSQYRDPIQFKEKKFKLKHGDILYMFSDGYQDQFGYKEDKKLMSKRFRELLFEGSHHSMLDQKIHLAKFLQTWKKNVEQTDDILVVGIRV